MSITDIVTALGSHNYLGLLVLLALYVRKLTGPDSKLPVELSPNWRPVVSALAGLVYGVLASREAGSPWATAALGGVVAAGASGFLDGLLTAIFSHDNAPSWAKAIVFIFDDVTAVGGGTPPTPPAIKFGFKASPKLPKPMFPQSTSSPPPPKMASRTWGGLWLAFGMMLAVFTPIVVGAAATACTPAQSAILSSVEQTVLNDIVAGKTRIQIELDVASLLAGQPGVDVLTVLNDALAVLIDLGVVPPSFLTQTKAMHAELTKAVMIRAQEMK
jgi:hypothetical protein